MSESIIACNRNAKDPLVSTENFEPSVVNPENTPSNFQIIEKETNKGCDVIKPRKEIYENSIIITEESSEKYSCLRSEISSKESEDNYPIKTENSYVDWYLRHSLIGKSVEGTINLSKYFASVSTFTKASSEENPSEKEPALLVEQEYQKQM